MKTENVIERARRYAMKRRTSIFIFRDDDEPGGYGLADEWECDTWYAGQHPIACIGPDGMMEGVDS